MRGGGEPEILNAPEQAKNMQKVREIDSCSQVLLDVLDA